MKHTLITLLAIVSLLFASCCKDHGFAKVHVRVDDFAISQEEFSAKTASNVADYSGVKAITLAFYKGDGTEQYKVTQLRADANTYNTFGDFYCSLPMGSYTMVVIGHGLNDGEPAVTLTSPTSATYGDNTVRETFAATQAVNITSTNALTLSATLNRVISRLDIRSTDNQTENAYSIRATFSAGGKSFNPTTGLATANTGFTNTVVLQTPAGGIAGSINYLFLASDEQNINITFDVLDSDGNTLTHKVINDVPFKCNRKTVLTGNIFTAGGDGSFRVESDWLESTTITF